MEKLMPLPTMKEFIWDEFMEPLHISVKKMAHDINLPETEIQDVLDGKKEVTIDIPTDKPGTYTYACGMDMFRGKVVVK